MITRRKLMQWFTGSIPAFCSPRAFSGTTSSRLFADASPAVTKRSIAPGLFQPTWESLKQYQAPQWFRDAKFGIWAHWSAQCVPEQGDWYARQMYIQGHPQNKYHVEHYGPPSQFGFKDIDHLWKAEKWEPEELMQLYVRAGAKYFVSLANHHDNFDCYDSRHHEWNSLRVGPKKDIVGTWAHIARRHGLHFGVTNHSAHSWHWFQTAYGYDPEGPLAGVRYDGFLTKKDGKGKWWEGLDPQELYTGPNMVMPEALTSIKAANEWHSEHDRKWMEEPPVNNPKFVDKWFLRCQDLIDRYDPDLLYFDNTELPLGQAGLDIAGHFYNSNMRRRNGRLEAVLNSKGLKPEHMGTMVLDIERGRASQILPDAWQTDTCLGQWHYRRSLYEEHRYKSAETVIRMLVDIVSKNGNLLLNIPLRGDGSIDEDEQKLLASLASWMPDNREAIFGTRPFAVFGEGPPETVSTGNFNESKMSPYTAEDIRFTTKGNILYAIALGWPARGKIVIKTLATGSPHYRQAVGKVELLGVPGPLRFTRDENGLTVELPERKPNDYAYAFKLTPDATAKNANPAPIQHEFLAIDEGKGNLLHINERDPSRNWIVPVGRPQARDMQLIGGNRVLISHDNGYTEFDIATGKVIAEVSSYHGVTSARRQPTGNTLITGVNLIGNSGVVVLEVGNDNKVISQIVFPGSYVRLMRQTAKGTYLFMCDTRIREGDLQGRYIWDSPVEGFSHAWKAVRLPNGNTLASAGYGAFMVEVDPAGRIVRKFGGKETVAAAIHPFFYATFQLLPNGHVVVANWQGHGPGHGDSGVQLLEFDKDRVVWSWSKTELISSMQGVLVLDGLDTSLLHDERNGRMEPMSLPGRANKNAVFWEAPSSLRI